MGLGNFFRKLFDGPTENTNEPVLQSGPDPVKDASDFVMPAPEIVSEQTEPVIETNGFSDDSNDDIEEIRKFDRESDDRVEEAAD